MARRRSRRGVACKRVRVKGHTKTVCRSKRTGRIVRGGGKQMVCPKTYRGKKVYRQRKTGSCYIKGRSSSGSRYRRYVKKVAKGSKRARR